jgi:hypothetical protein
MNLLFEFLEDHPSIQSSFEVLSFVFGRGTMPRHARMVIEHEAAAE